MLCVLLSLRGQKSINTCQIKSVTRVADRSLLPWNTLSAWAFVSLPKCSFLILLSFSTIFPKPPQAKLVQLNEPCLWPSLSHVCLPATISLSKTTPCDASTARSPASNKDVI